MITMFNKWYPAKSNLDSAVTFIRFDHYKTLSGKYAVRLLTGYGIDELSKDSPNFAQMPALKYRSTRQAARTLAVNLLNHHNFDEKLIVAFDEIELFNH